MKDQKAENLLNLALSVPEEERKQTGELDVGYDRETRTWELIVKYSGDLAGIVREQFPEAELKELSGGFGILTVPEEEVPGILGLKEIEYAEKPKRLFFAINQAKAASCLTLVQQGPKGLTGRGVLVGILDSGIDYFHGDFRHEDGTGRILFLNDQVTRGTCIQKEEDRRGIGDRKPGGRQELWFRQQIREDMERRWLGSPQGMEGKAEAGTGAWPMRVIWWWSVWGRRIQMAFPGPHR